MKKLTRLLLMMLVLMVSASLMSCDDVTGSQDNPVDPTPIPAPTYASDLERPLTFEAAMDGVKVTFKFKYNAKPDYRKVEYSLDQGATWTALKRRNQAILLEKKGDMVMFRGDNDTYNGDAQFVTELVNANARTRTLVNEASGGSIYAFLFGNVMSLIQNKDFATIKALAKANQAAFKTLFKNARIDAQNANGTKKLVLPAIGQEVVIDAFKGMFEGSTIQNAPKVVAEVLGYGTIADMFKDCEDLKNVFLSLGYLAEGTTPEQAMGGVLGGTTGKNAGGTSDPNAGRGPNVIWAPLPPRLDEEGRSIFNGDNRPLSLDDVMNASGIAEDVLKTAKITMVNAETGITSDPTNYIAVKSIVIQKGGIVIGSADVTEGDVIELFAQLSPDGVTDKTVTWSLNEVDGSVSFEEYREADQGAYVKVRGERTGCCKVIASHGIIHAVIYFYVLAKTYVTGVTLDNTTLELAVGESKTLTATVAASEDAPDKTVTWSSDKESVATVDKDGKITAVAAGEATITVKTNDGGFTATCKVTVLDANSATIDVTMGEEDL